VDNSPSPVTADQAPPAAGAADMPGTADLPQTIEPADSRSAAFNAVRWDGENEQVRVGSTWYELVAFDGVPAGQIIQFAKDNYPDSDPVNPLWKKRVTEDLVRC